MDESQHARVALDRLIAERGENYADLSRLIGRNAAYIQQFIKRGTPRKLDEADRRVLARYFGVPETMLGGVDETAAQPTRTRGLPAVVAVPRLALGASAGVGSLDDDERAAGVMAFDARWLRYLGVRPQRVSIIRVDGESMAPTLNDGDDIMVDHDDAAERLRKGMSNLSVTDTPAPDKADGDNRDCHPPGATHFLLYLNDKTYLGAAGELLAQELRDARGDGARTSTSTHRGSTRASSGGGDKAPRAHGAPQRDRRVR